MRWETGQNTALMTFPFMKGPSKYALRYLCESTDSAITLSYIWCSDQLMNGEMSTWENKLMHSSFFRDAPWESVQISCFNILAL